MSQRQQPDRYFSSQQQQRLAELMARWRAARNAGQMLSAVEQSELESLVEAELQASGQRANEIVHGIGS